MRAYLDDEEFEMEIYEVIGNVSNSDKEMRDSSILSIGVFMLHLGIMIDVGKVLCTHTFHVRRELQGDD